MAQLFLFYYILGIVLYIIKREYALYYYIVWLCCFSYPISYFVLDVNAINGASGQANYYLLLVLIIDYVRYRRDYYIHSASIVLLIVIVSLLFISSVFHNINFRYYADFCRSCFLPILLASTYLTSLKKISLSSVIKFIYGLCFFELALCLVQYFFHIGVSTYNILLFDEATRNKNVESAMYGTFYNSNVVMSVTTLCFLVIAAAYKKNWKTIWKVMFYILAGMELVSVVFSGIRTYLMLFVFFTMVFLFIKSHNKFLVTGIILGTITLFLSFFLISDYEYYAKEADENPIMKQIYGVSMTAHGDVGEGTMYLVTSTLDYYRFYDILGRGELFKRGYGQIRMDEGNVTDATLSVYLVEFGIILLILMLAYYYQITIKATSFKKMQCTKFCIYIFWYLLLTTITDVGLFSAFALLVLAMYNYTSTKDKYYSKVECLK